MVPKSESAQKVGPGDNSAGISQSRVWRSNHWAIPAPYNCLDDQFSMTQAWRQQWKPGHIINITILGLGNNNDCTGWLKVGTGIFFTAGTTYRSLSSLTEARSFSLITERNENLLKPFSWSAALTFSVGKQQFVSYLSIQNGAVTNVRVNLIWCRVVWRKH